MTYSQAKPQDPAKTNPSNLEKYFADLDRIGAAVFDSRVPRDLVRLDLDEVQEGLAAGFRCSAP
ncbi:hypothetical protein FJZ17_03070 [Candidatus Pacearchaeota archaeon]|nr:hypothetical protein [Candidatus Pacearchaeota archaeon]